MSRGFPVPEPPPRANSPLQSLGRLAIILATVSIVAIPLAVLEGPREIARWHEAAAVEKYLDGDLDLVAALDELDEAAGWDADSLSIYLLRAHLKKRHGSYRSALDDCDEALAIDDRNISALLERSDVYQHLGRHAEAVADWQTIGKLIDQRSAVITSIPLKWRRPVDLPPGLNNSSTANGIGPSSALNGSAYARAVGNIDLDTALVEIGEAIEMTGGQIKFFHLAGCFHYHRQRYDSALRDVGVALEMAEAKYRDVETKQTAQLRGQRDRALALLGKLHVHRGMILEKLDRSDEAQEEYDRARQLDVNVKSFKQDFPAKKRADEAAGAAAALLDTRGYLHFRRGEWKPARRDLETACDLAEILLDEELRQRKKYQHLVVDPRELRLITISQVKKHAAVIFYHRALLDRAQKLHEEADRDFRRVKELGFEPNEHLF